MARLHTDTIRCKSRTTIAAPLTSLSMNADSLTDPLHDAAAAPAEDDSAFPSDWLHYSGATSRGWVHLSIPRAADAPAAPPTGEEQVLRLAEAEALVACVEEWLHVGWDPAPAQEAPPAGALAAASIQGLGWLATHARPVARRSAAGRTAGAASGLERRNRAGAAGQRASRGDTGAGSRSAGVAAGRLCQPLGSDAA